MEKQKEYYLNEQMKALKELGEIDEAEGAEQLESKINEAGMPKEAQEKPTELQNINDVSMSAEASVVRVT